MTWRPDPRAAALAALVLATTACVPVTVNISFSQEKLDTAPKQIEDVTAQTPAPSAPAATSPAPAPPATSQGRTVDVTPRINTRSPEVVKATESRRQRRGAPRMEGARCPARRTRGCRRPDRRGMHDRGAGADAAENGPPGHLRGVHGRTTSRRATPPRAQRVRRGWQERLRPGD
jgi:hypothetical protein